MDHEAVGQLIRAGRSAEAVELAEVLLARAADDAATARLLLMKLGALLNLERFEDCPAVVDAAHAVLAGSAEPALLGEFGALAAGVAFQQGSLERSVTHLIRGVRALELLREHTGESAMAWLDLATTYSYIGFHEEAVATLARARQAADLAGVAASSYVHPEIGVRHALWLDHLGDTAGCVRELLEVYASLDPAEADTYDLPYLGYAGARLAALGVSVPGDPAEVLASQPIVASEHVALLLLGRACLAVAAHRPGDALAALAAAEATGSVPAAEVLRLRGLAHAAAGDYPAALAAERASVAAVVNGPGRLNSLYLEGIAARLDQDDLRRSVTRYADEAHTDLLTGLPNRRHLERFVADLLDHGTYGTIGVGDLNGFKAVNTVHGHLSGDEVLGQVAAILRRALRTGDFLARYGGDEFVIVLPDTRLAEAAEVIDRVTAAVAIFDWATLVPGTPVSLAMGLGELGPGTDFTAAFRAADLRMLRAKT